jgi:nicotinamide-nucleotide amidase
MKPSPFQSDCTPLVKLFLQYKLTLALAESCTCGLVAAQLAPAEGISDVLLGSVVTRRPSTSTRPKASKPPTRW